MHLDVVLFSIFIGGLQTKFFNGKAVIFNFEAIVEKYEQKEFAIVLLSVVLISSLTLKDVLYCELVSFVGYNCFNLVQKALGHEECSFKTFL